MKEVVLTGGGHMVSDRLKAPLSTSSFLQARPLFSYRQPAALRFFRAESAAWAETGFQSIFRSNGITWSIRKCV